MIQSERVCREQVFWPCFKGCMEQCGPGQCTLHCTDYMLVRCSFWLRLGRWLAGIKGA